jgi:hypothetical protein
MPKQGWEGVTELIGDLYRETTPIVRTCLFGGAGLGLIVTIWFFAAGPNTGILIIPRSLAALSVLAFLFFVPTIIGGFVGCFFGVLLEIILGKNDRPGGGNSTRRRR